MIRAILIIWLELVCATSLATALLAWLLLT
jgi:hypothetical protein